MNIMFNETYCMYLLIDDVIERLVLLIILYQKFFFILIIFMNDSIKAIEQLCKYICI